jgi:hypothetical protein
LMPMIPVQGLALLSFWLRLSAWSASNAMSGKIHLKCFFMKS